jgi:iron complex outermembrane recepter protein
MILPAFPHRSLLATIRVLTVSALVVISATAADDAKRSYNLPAGDAAVALRQFSETSGKEVLFAAETVRGVRTPALRGDFTSREAMAALLGGTGLVATPDTKSGAIAVRRADGPNAPRAAPADNARPAGKTDDRMLVLDKVEVGGRRIDGLNNKGLLQGGANAPLYHDVVTRLDIERSGVTSLEELFRLIPQTSTPRTSFQTNDNTSGVSGGMTTRFSTMGLRGFDSGQTVILINGRALPRTGTGNVGGADLSRVPLAAIERVEIMPYAGSAIYGAGAIGGAINIILRKGYAGQELTVYVGTSTDGGAGEYRATLLDGRIFADGKGRITTTLSYQHRDPLRLGQRDYLERAAAKYGPGNKTIVDGSGRTPFETFILPAFVGAPATIVVGNAPTAAVNDLGIPGAPGVRWATVPVGTTAAGSRALTPASFGATAGQSVPAGQSPRNARNVLYEPIDTYSANAQLEYDILKDDRLSGYGEFTYGFNRKQYSFPQSTAVSLSATDPLNPFRANVTPGFVGRPVTVYLHTPDIEEPSTAWEYESARAVLGLKGKLSERFEWSVDGAIDYADNTVDSNNPPNNMLALSSLATGVAGSAPVDVRRAIYPILADHNQFPISDATESDYFYSVRYSATRAVQTEGNARVTGDLWELPAGPLRASAIAKYQAWDHTSSQRFKNSTAYAQLIYGGPFPESPSATESSRNIWQGAVELSLPIISEKWRPIPVEGFEVQGSASQERNTTMRPGAVDNKQTGDSSVIAAKLQLTKDIAFRASYSEAFAPPDWGNVLNPASSFFFPLGVLPDPLRGNTPQGPGFNVLSGGNPNLEPEQAKSENFGVILTPRFLPKLTLNVDYWQIEKTDAILSVAWPTAIANPLLYAFLATRAPVTPAEQALGWAGVVTQFDQRPINASRTKTEGMDFRVRYGFDTASIGSFDFTANASFTNNFLLKITPTAPEINSAGGSGPVRWRGNGAVSWNRRPWTVTLGARYVGHFSTGTTSPSPSYPGAIAYDGGRIPAYMHYDLQATYEVKPRAGERGWRSWVAGTKWTVGVNNVLNEEPDFMTGLGTIGSGQSFYNVYDDPRQRFVYLSINKSL